MPPSVAGDGWRVALCACDNRSVELIAALTILAFVAVAAVHVYWARGGSWPGTDRTDLARRVVGTETFPSNRDTYGVVVALVLAVLLVGASARFWGAPVSDGWVRFGTWGVFAVLALRGVGGLIFSLEALRRGSTNPFVRPNIKIYSPLVIVLAIGVLIVAL